MSITQAMCTSFKAQLLTGVHNFSTHTFKIALYTDSAVLSAATESYVSEGEIEGSGYTAGGAVLEASAVTVSNGVALVDFADVSWPAVTFSARGALIYNSTAAGNPAVAVLDFGADRSASGSAFTVQFPAPTGDTAIVRIV
jgi:hypothetical protein